jgi:hypothetical protein
MVALVQQLQNVGAKGLRAPNVIRPVPLQRPAQLARLFLRFGQLGLLVSKLSVQVLLGAAQSLHVVAQRFKDSFGGLRRVFSLLLQPPGAFLFRSQSPL